MRENFFEYFRPTKAETEELWKNAHFVFDTNVLLNLYRMSAETSAEMLKILEIIKDRVFLPHQVGVEFFRNAESEIAKQVNAFESVKSSLKKISSDFSKDLIRHPCIPISDIKEALEKCVLAQIEIVNKSQSDNQINFLVHDDPIISKLSILFSKSSAGASSTGEEDEITKNIEDRIKQNEAPCYTSNIAKTKVESNPHIGDGKVWFQILRYAEDKKCPIIFITGDTQENWWRTVKLGNKERAVGPHFVLIKDVTSITEKNFWMYTQTEFLEKAHEYLGAQDQAKGIEEVRNISEALGQSVAVDVPDDAKEQTPDMDSASKPFVLIDDLDSNGGLFGGESSGVSLSKFFGDATPDVDGEEK